MEIIHLPEARKSKSLNLRMAMVTAPAWRRPSSMLELAPTLFSIFGKTSVLNWIPRRGIPFSRTLKRTAHSMDAVTYYYMHYILTSM